MRDFLLTVIACLVFCIFLIMMDIREAVRGGDPLVRPTPQRLT